MKRNIKENIRCSAILIDSLQTIFSLEDINELEMCLKQENIHLEMHTHQPQYIAGIEELFAQVQILLSPDIVYAITTGILTNGMYDVLKQFLKRILTKMSSVRLTKLQGEKEAKEVPPTIHFNIGQTHVILPLGIDDTKYEYFVDKMFEYMGSQDVKKGGYCIWNDENEEVKIYTQSEIAQKAFLEQTAREKMEKN